MADLIRRLSKRALRAHTRVRFLASAIRVGRHAAIHPRAKLERLNGGAITIGDRCVIHDGAMLLTYGGAISIGSDCTINPYTILHGQGGLTIGDYVRIAAHCTIIPANHGIALDKGVIAKQPMKLQAITIEDDVWIGAGVRILAGAHIERGAVVAAGAVVRGRLPAYSICGGVPAKLLRMRT
ncbi:MAG: acyltransferase [Hyphomonadaceae bacterium]|nr:acyltransferase [Hyphomonadaceae bacterium]